jgi:hypothetical protein
MPGQRRPMVGLRSLKSPLILIPALTGIACAAVATVATLAAGAAAADRPGAFTLAMLRRDGILVPFAAYDGKHWKNPWPVPEKTANMPITVDGIPKGWWLDKQPLLEWTVWPPTGATASGSTDGSTGSRAARTIHVNGITWFLAQCLQGVGLRTDYKPAVLPPPPRVHPYPKDGLAVSGHVTISPIEQVPRTDKSVTTLSARLPDTITPKEEVVIKRYMMHNGWTHSYTEQERATVPISVEALYRVPRGLAGLDVYFFEAVKRYVVPKPSEHRDDPPVCDLATFVSGWFTTKADGSIDDLRTRVHVTGCDLAGDSFMLPFGTITLDGHTLWIVQWSNAQQEFYTIFEPTAKEGEAPLVFETSGGSCVTSEEEEEQQ